MSQTKSVRSTAEGSVQSSLSGKLFWLECAKMSSILLVAAILIAFGCSATASITKQQDSFYFDPAPINQDVLEGEPVKLRCDVSNRKMIYFYWTLNGRQLTNTSRRFQEDSDLRILWVDRHHDNGSLRCIATNVSTGIALRSAEAKLNILCKYVHCAGLRCQAMSILRETWLKRSWFLSKFSVILYGLSIAAYSGTVILGGACLKLRYRRQVLLIFVMTECC